MSIGGPQPASGDRTTAAPRTLRVEAVFRDLAQEQMETIAAAMIDRAHELANLPECECDLDVSVQSGSAGAPARPDHAAGPPAPGAPSEP